MMELIKSKQNDDITKELITSKELDQLMLRFTRIYRDESGKFQRDHMDQAYSCIMKEHYGDVGVEFISPTFGSMCSPSIITIVLTGPIKNDDEKKLSIKISKQTNDWSVEIEQFILNGKVIHFKMPFFQYPPMSHVKANISVYYENEKIHESIYLYMNFSHVLLHDHLNESIKNFDELMTKKKHGHVHIYMLE
ncbi:unnamed protein product [Rotaria sp. Silwood1]|nr:unnamed protein product [Rotaria sp. Silwood1]